MTAKFTLVTAFFDIKHTTDKRAKVNDYFNYFHFLAALPYPLVVFIESKHSHTAETILKKYRQNSYQLILKEFKELYLYKYFEAFKNSKCHINPISSTSPEYAVVTASKSFLMAEAAKSKFKNLNLVWIDFGIYHGLNLVTSDVKDIMKSFANRIKGKLLFNLMNIIPKEETLNRKEYYHYNRGLISAQMLAGPESEIIKFNQKLELEIELALKDGYYGLDEQYWGALVCREPENYDYIFGDYGCNLANADIFRIHHNTISLCLNAAFKLDQHSIVTLVVKEMIKTIKYVRVDKNIFLDVLNKGYVSSYYVDRQFSHYLGKIIVMLYHHGSKNYFDQITNLRDNLGYNGLKLEDQIELNDLEDAWALLQYFL